MSVTERGVADQGRDGRFQLGKRVLLALFGEEIFVIVDIAVPAAQRAALVMAQRKPERFTGQGLQTVGGNVRGSLQQAASATQQEWKQNSKHEKPMARA